MRKHETPYHLTDRGSRGALDGYMSMQRERTTPTDPWATIAANLATHASPRREYVAR